MDFLSLSLPSFYVPLFLSPSLFSILQSPEASISLITESLHLNGRLCIVRTKGRAASEEVLDRGMDWAQRLGWVELQVQASFAGAENGSRSDSTPNCRGTFLHWEKGDFCAPAALQCDLLLRLNCKGENRGRRESADWPLQFLLDWVSLSVQMQKRKPLSLICRELFIVTWKQTFSGIC